MTSAPIDVARQFVSAIAWGEHRTVWELLSPGGRATVLKVATSRGMDAALSARLRDSQATRGEVDTFLADLINGLRTDLAGTDLDTLEFDLGPGACEPGRMWVLVIAPVADALGVPGLPVGTIELAQLDDTWRIERFTPRALR